MAMFHVHVETARKLPNHDWFGKIDPYCIVKCAHTGGILTQKTNRIKNGGPDVTWNETLHFDGVHVDGDVRLFIEVYDKDKLKDDDLLGFAVIDLGPFVGKHPPHPPGSVPQLSYRGIRLKQYAHGPDTPAEVDLTVTMYVPLTGMPTRRLLSSTSLAAGTASIDDIMASYPTAP
ncbi:hypothetical protein GGF32_004905 [Allomyces javanicus]|nr:hypothetical protein GGF32_004905 [Allomyces javanicus]